jgi:microcystin degradation protein MlrC
VVSADGADNAGGGAPSDATFMLRRLFERAIDRAIIGPLWDPIAVALVFDAGEGAMLPLRIGGKIGPVSGAPLDAVVKVVALRRDAAMTGLSGTREPMGDAALVAIGGVEVVLNSRRTQGFSTDMFTQFGVDLAQRRVVVTKSSQHFFESFSKVAARVIYADGPGTLTGDLTTLPYVKARRAVVESF